MSLMKFLIIGDLHGNKPNIYFRDFDAIIAPGDFCSDGPKNYMFKAYKEHLKNPDSKLQWYDMPGKRKAKEMIKKSLADGRKVLEYLDSFGVPVYIVPGNWDFTKSYGHYWEWEYLHRDHYKNLLNGLTNIIDVNNKRIDINGFQIIGYGISSAPEYPQHKDIIDMLTKSELKKKKQAYGKLFRKFSSLFKKAKKPVIFLSHNVPFNTPIDKINDKNSPRYGYHFGSLLVREIIDKHQPLICIGAHMHEHFGKCKLGKTVALNSGYGSNVNILMELKDNEIKKLKFYKRN